MDLSNSRKFPTAAERFNCNRKSRACFLIEHAKDPDIPPCASIPGKAVSWIYRSKRTAIQIKSCQASMFIVTLTCLKTQQRLRTKTISKKVTSGASIIYPFDIQRAKEHSDILLSIEIVNSNYGNSIGVKTFNAISIDGQKRPAEDDFSPINKVHFASIQTVRYGMTIGEYLDRVNSGLDKFRDDYFDMRSRVCRRNALSPTPAPPIERNAVIIDLCRSEPIPLDVSLPRNDQQPDPCDALAHCSDLRPGNAQPALCDDPSSDLDGQPSSELLQLDWFDLYESQTYEGNEILYLGD